MPTTHPLPPSPKGVPIFGNFLEYRRDPLGAFTRWTHAYGDVVALRFGPVPGVLFTHPDQIEEVLVTKSRHFMKGVAGRMTPELLGNGLLTSEGDFWLRQRRLAQPAFHRERLAGYAEVMVRYAEAMLDGWKDGEIRDTHHDMMYLTMQIVGKTLFDANVAEEAAELGEVITSVIHHWNWKISTPPLIPEWFPTRAKRQYARDVTRLDALIYGFIDKRRAAGAEPGDLLSMLLSARDDDGQGMTDKQVRDECMTIFLAGHETTANALTWTFHLLADHPEVEAKLHAEVQAVLGGRAPTMADLPRLPYAEAVLTEAMRLRPPVWGFGREVVDDVEVGGYLVPKGTQVVLSQWVTQRDPRYFAEPERFQPERWLDGLAKRIPAYAYFPFGGGPRLCIGRPFAMMEGVLILAAISQRFRLQAVPGFQVEPEPSITLRPKRGLRMHLTAR